MRISAKALICESSYLLIILDKGQRGQLVTPPGSWGKGYRERFLIIYMTQANLTSVSLWLYVDIFLETTPESAISSTIATGPVNTTTGYLPHHSVALFSPRS